MVAKRPRKGGVIQPHIRPQAGSRGQCKLETREVNKSVNVEVTTTSRGECIRLCDVEVMMSS
jgi:hypothetical protein